GYGRWSPGLACPSSDCRAFSSCQSLQSRCVCRLHVGFAPVWKTGIILLPDGRCSKASLAAMTCVSTSCPAASITARLSRTGSPPSSCEELTTIALTLRERVELSAEQRFRLVGIGLSNFREPEGTQTQPALFE